MKQVKPQLDSFLTQIVSLTVAEIFFCSSILPAWASPIDFLRPRTARSGSEIVHDFHALARDGAEKIYPLITEGIRRLLAELKENPRPLTKEEEKAIQGWMIQHAWDSDRKMQDLVIEIGSFMPLISPQEAELDIAQKSARRRRGDEGKARDGGGQKIKMVQAIDLLQRVTAPGYDFVSKVRFGEEGRRQVFDAVSALKKYASAEEAQVAKPLLEALRGKGPFLQGDPEENRQYVDDIALAIRQMHRLLIGYQGAAGQDGNRARDGGERRYNFETMTPSDLERVVMGLNIPELIEIFKIEQENGLKAKMKLALERLSELPDDEATNREIVEALEAFGNKHKTVLMAHGEFLIEGIARILAKRADIGRLRKMFGLEEALIDHALARRPVLESKRDEPRLHESDLPRLITVIALGLTGKEEAVGPLYEALGRHSAFLDYYAAEGLNNLAMKRVDIRPPHLEAKLVLAEKYDDGRPIEPLGETDTTFVNAPVHVVLMKVRRIEGEKGVRQPDKEKPPPDYHSAMLVTEAIDRQHIFDTLSSAQRDSLADLYEKKGEERLDLFPKIPDLRAVLNAQRLIDSYVQAELARRFGYASIEEAEHYFDTHRVIIHSVAARVLRALIEQEQEEARDGGSRIFEAHPYSVPTTFAPFLTSP